MTKPHLIIGDVHGHFDRLDALLVQEGIINEHGERINHDVTVVQLGDLGHFGSAWNGYKMIPGSPTGDQVCYEAVWRDNWVDIVLWGNHDRAVVDSWHGFNGYVRPPAETLHMMKSLEHEGRLLMAYACHDYLITHAGLAAAFKFQKGVPNSVKEDPKAFADFVNTMVQKEIPGDVHAIWDAIGSRRGGRSATGGILWRDQGEKLYRTFKQVYGHSASKRGKVVQFGESYNIDIGGKEEARLAGIWLPERKIVRVDL